MPPLSWPALSSRRASLRLPVRQRLVTGLPERNDDQTNPPAGVPACCCAFSTAISATASTIQRKFASPTECTSASGAGIHEVDGVRHAVLDGELDRVQVIAQRAAQRQRIALDAREQLGSVRRRILHVALVEGTPRIVRHDVDLLLIDHVAAEVFLELHRALQRHAEVAGLVVGLEELLPVVHVIDVAPSAAIEGLEERREADVLEDALPVERVLEIAHRAVRGAGRILLVRQQDGARHGDAQLAGESVVEKFVVRGPPERIVDDDGPGERRVLQEAAIEGNVVRDAVDDDRIAAGRCLAHAADLDGLGSDVGKLHRVDALDQRSGEGVLHAVQDANLLHLLLLPSRVLILSLAPSVCQDHAIKDKHSSCAARWASRGCSNCPRSRAGAGQPRLPSRWDRCWFWPRHWSSQPVAST